MSAEIKRYAIVGTGGRSYMYHKALTGKYKDTCSLVAVCDLNPGRTARAVRKAAEAGVEGVPAYEYKQFDRMIAETKPDTVIVTTNDCFHDEYICRAMEAGCDVVTEKPMTTDEVKCQRVIDTVKRTGKTVRVTFNYRYSPLRIQVKQLLMDETIGRILSVDFQWLLNTRHGADYYRRWHRNKVNSGGLMIHKASHHFDLINWWLDTTPEEVFAIGKREFYVPATADELGLQGRGERCHGCPVADKCKFFLDLSEKENMRELYLECEQHDGYFRDRCVFDESIDIEDTMNVTARYRGGATMSYSLNSFTPWEGYIVNFNGTRGRIEHKNVETAYVSGDGTVPGETIKAGSSVTVFPTWANPYSVEVEQGVGGHGGGDIPLLDDVFMSTKPPDPMNRAADHVAGAYSILPGIAANKSIAAGGKMVRIADLVTGLPTS